MKITIPAENYDSLSRKLIALNNKAQKLGLEEITLDIKSSLGIATPDPKEKGLFKEAEYLQIEVMGEPPVLSGWKFVGIIEPTNIGNILIEIRSQYPIPEKYRHTDLCDCEHCGIKRDRNTAFVVMNEETKEFLQVGRVCLKSYTSDTDPKNIALYESFFKLKDFEHHRDSNYGKSIYNPDKLLAFYFKGEDLYPESKKMLQRLATSDLMELYNDKPYYNQMIDMRNNIYLNIDENTYQKVEEFKQSILKLDDTGQNKIWNYKLVLQEKYTSNPHIVFESVEFKEAHDRHLTLEAKRMQEQMARLKAKQDLLEKKKSRSFVGTPNEKSNFHVSLEKALIRDSGYGPYILYVFRDESENNLTCFHSGKPLFDGDKEKDLMTSKDKFYISGKVKEHNTYDDEPQTKLTHIKYLGETLPEPKQTKTKKNSL